MDNMVKEEIVLMKEHPCKPSVQFSFISRNGQCKQIPIDHNMKRQLELSIMVLRFIVLITLMNNPLITSVKASCMTSSGVPICCRGRQAACSSYDFTAGINKTAFNPYNQMQGHLLNRLTKLKPCYCDEHCTITGDCCSDYRELCRKPIVHCEVGTWGAWGPCNRACGKGIRVRQRQVVKQAQNGGRHCPVLRETTPCEGYRCGSRRVSRSRSGMILFLHRAQSEVAHLLPDEGDALQMIRRWSMRWDVRRKLYLGRLIKQNRTELPEPEPYCALYKLTHRSAGCQLKNYQPWSNREYLGWDSQNNPRSPSIISGWQGANTYKQFKNGYSAQLPSVWNQGQLHRRTWEFRVSQLAENQPICVTCYPGYMREDLGMRCSGTGLMNVETRWRALRTTDCHGKFRMISMPQRSCTCAKGTTSFIFV